MDPEYAHDTEPSPSDPPHPKMVAENMEGLQDQARQAAEFHERKANEARQTLRMAEAALEQHKLASIEDRKAMSGGEEAYDRG